MGSPMDSLLAYASVKGSGTIPDFRQACARLEMPSPWPALRRLDALGHVDLRVEYEGPAWSCAHPVLATLPDEHGIAVASGARAAGLRQLLAGELTLTIEEYPDAPQVWRARGSEEELARAAERAGLVLPSEPPASTLARAIPPLRRFLDGVARPIVLPASKTPPARWDPVAGEWVEASRVDCDGLWRVVDRYTGRRVHLIRLGGHVLEVRDLGAGHAAASALARRSYVQYNRAERRVVVERGRLLPRLHARALALCSGRPPVHGNDGVSYAAVPESIARLITVKLHLEGQS